MNKEERVKLILKDKERLERFIKTLNEERKIAGMDNELMTIEEHIEIATESKLNNAKEEFLGIDISSYLEKIRHNDFESTLTLVIKDGKVADELLVEGLTGSCFTKQKDIEDSVEKYHSDIILSIHNHPLCIGAKPSLSDYGSWISTAYGRDYKVAIGVVSEYDYWQSDQDNIGCMEEARKHFESKKLMFDRAKLNILKQKLKGEKAKNTYNSKEEMLQSMIKTSKILKGEWEPEEEKKTLTLEEYQAYHKKQMEELAIDKKAEEEARKLMPELEKQPLIYTGKA